MEKCFSALLLWLLILLLPGSSFAGAWSPEKGSGQVITTLSYYSISTSSANAPTTKFHKTELSSYVEFGITDSLTLGAVPRFQSQSSAAETISGEIFLRKNLWQSEHAVFSVQPLFQLPGAYSTTSYTMLDDQDYAQGELRLLTGYSNSYRNTSFFWDGEVAYRAALNARAEEWHIDHTLGIRVLPSWLMLMQLFTTYRPGGVAETVTLTSSDGWGNSSTLQYPIFHTYFDSIAQISVVHPITNTISIQVGTFSHILEGKEWLGNGVLVSLWVNF